MYLEFFHHVKTKCSFLLYVLQEAPLKNPVQWYWIGWGIIKWLGQNFLGEYFLLCYLQ